ncbi:MAG TPA: hypothetical protein VEI25_20045 [Paraburkholderia sp.]|nr:hypothetical protein [Paraburkholderia sp.]
MKFEARSAQEAPTSDTDLAGLIRPGDTVMWGLSLAQRVPRVIAIAHPEHRERLGQEARVNR